MNRITRIAFCAVIWAAGAAAAVSQTSDFEDELEIVDESYFTEEPYVREEPRPRTITLGQAAWTPFNIRRGFSMVHLMNEQACRRFLEGLRDNKGTACMNVNNGVVFYPIDFIGPVMP